MKNATITIIEDDRDLGNLLEKLLQLHDYKTKLFRSGEDFLNDNSHSDLFIVDLNLGGVSGIEICIHIKTTPNLKDQPVILISAHPELDHLAKKAQANVHLTKPFTRMALLEQIKLMLSPNHD